MPDTFAGFMADLLDPPVFDPFPLLGYVPTPRQAEFHAASEFDVLYGGAAGGGKTRSLLMECLRVAATIPGIRVGAFRRTYDELAESLLKELASCAYGEALGAAWNGSNRELTLPNRSVIRFRYAETEVDASRRQGGEYQLIVIDERGLMRPSVVGLLEERLRSGRKDIPVLGIRSTTNPGGPGHGALKARYMTATEGGQHAYTDGQGRSVRFIPAKVADNPHVDPGYLAQLDAIPDPARRAAMRDGDWDSFAGQAFGEWRHDRHVVDPFDLPESWQVYCGMDYGWTAPSVVLWAARDQDGRMWVTGELMMRQTPEREQARRVLQTEAGHQPVLRSADPAMWGRVGSANPPAVQFALEGCALSKADNSRVPGKQRVHTYLAEAPACPMHDAQGWVTCPMLHVMDGRAPDLVRTLPELPLDPRNSEDVDTTGDDHAYDALRYLLMGVGTIPQFVFDTAPDPLLMHDIGGVAADPAVLATPRPGGIPDNDPGRFAVRSSPWA